MVTQVSETGDDAEEVKTNKTDQHDIFIVTFLFRGFSTLLLVLAITEEDLKGVGILHY